MAITLDGSNGILSPDFEPSSSTLPTNGLYLPSANTLGLATNGTGKAFLDSAGNLGLGVTPSAWRSAEKVLQIGSAAFSQYSTLTAAISLNKYTNSSNQNIYINSDYATAYYQNSGQHIWQIAPSGTAGNAISFTQAMTLDASGNLLVGTTSNTYSSRAVINGTALGTAPVLHTQSNYNQHGWRVNANLGARSDGTYGIIENIVSGPIYVTAYTQGVVLNSGATAWASNSDERLKTEIEPFTDALEKIISLRCGTGRYLSDSESVSRSFLIAQDVQKVLPEAVFVANDELGTLTLAYTDTIPLLVAAIKELTARLEALENK